MSNKDFDNHVERINLEKKRRRLEHMVHAVIGSMTLHHVHNSMKEIVDYAEKYLEEIDKRVYGEKDEQDA